MARFWVVAPSLMPEALFGDHHDNADGHGDHETYNVASLRPAIIEGVDPSGRHLDEAMPHWSMSEPDLADLVRYLQGSEGGPRVDRSSESERKHNDSH